MNRSSRFTVASGLFVAPIAFAAACYGPTEVIVDLSTDLRCGPTPAGDAPRTWIYRGEPGRYEPAPEAETDACEPGPVDAHIGTLSFVPSGSRDGRAAVRVVVARYPKTSAAECEGANTEHCIYATRSFSFVAHESRRLPIRLSRDCIGIRCGAGQTCVAGACVGDDVRCQGEACILPIDGDGGADGGALDASPEASVSRCRAPDGSDTLVSVKEPSLFASSPTTHAWVESDSTMFRVHTIPRAGGAPSQAFEAAGGSAKALALDGASAVVAYTNNFGVGVVRVGTDDVAVPGFNKIHLFVAAREAPRRVYAATGKGIFEIVKAEAVQIAETDATDFFVDASRFWSATPQGIVFFDRTTDVDPVLIPQSPSAARLGGAGGELYAGGAGTGFGESRGVLARISGNTAEVLEARRVKTTDDLVDDATHVYWREGEKVFRRSKGAPGAENVGLARGAIEHLTVDWEPGGCLYYWSEGSLVIQPKAPSAKLDASVGPDPAP